MCHNENFFAHCFMQVHVSGVKSKNLALHGLAHKVYYTLLHSQDEFSILHIRKVPSS